MVDHSDAHTGRHLDRFHADGVRIQIRIAESASDEIEPLERWFVDSGGAAWEPEWLIQQVASIALDAASRGREYPIEHYLEVNERRMNWGADGAFFEILLGIAAWATTSAAWDATKHIARTMGRRLVTGAPLEVEPTPLTDAEACSRARWIITSNYGENDVDLRIESVEVRPDEFASIVLDSPTWRYECDLAVHDGLVTIARIRRERFARWP